MPDSHRVGRNTFKGAPIFGPITAIIDPFDDIENAEAEDVRQALRGHVFSAETPAHSGDAHDMSHQRKFYE
jgi:hypothetical protein